MRFKLTKELCYLAGLAGRTRESEKSGIGIITQSDDIGDRFLKESFKLGVDPRKIIIEESGSFKHIHYYHSKIARMIAEIMKTRAGLPKKGRDYAIAFLAGAFDGNGHINRGSITIRKMERSDDLLLELMDVHTVNSKILNIKKFISLIKEQSILANQTALFQ